MLDSGGDSVEMNKSEGRDWWGKDDTLIGVLTEQKMIQCSDCMWRNDPHKTTMQSNNECKVMGNAVHGRCVVVFELIIPYLSPATVWNIMPYYQNSLPSSSIFVLSGVLGSRLWMEAYFSVGLRREDSTAIGWAWKVPHVGWRIEQAEAFFSLSEEINLAISLSALNADYLQARLWWWIGPLLRLLV